MLFIDNKYTRWYYNIINKARNRINDSEYTERHHIIPKSLGGNNSNDNLVNLTAREHFICHWLLTKMLYNKRSKYQMWNAFSAMLYWHNERQERVKISPIKYQLIKTKLSKQKSLNFSGENNPMFGRKHTDIARYKMSNSRKGHEVSLTTREKISKIHKGKVVSEETKEKFRGINNANYKPGVRNKMNATFERHYGKGITNPGQIPYTCEYCGSMGKGMSNYKRWHGHNCKSNNQ